MESILQKDRAGAFRGGYEPYAQLIHQMTTHTHRSQLIFTSRERPRGFGRLEGDSPRVRSLSLGGFGRNRWPSLLAQRGLRPADREAAVLVARYSGNPLALKLVADTIDQLFEGDIARFLSDQPLIFDDIRAVLDQQFARLSQLEQDILFGLAIAREAMSPSDLKQNSARAVNQRDFMEALLSLQRRSMLEKSGAAFVLQNVIIEYLTDRLVEQACGEIETGNLNLVNRFALIYAKAPDYIRESQTRVILAPIGSRLTATMGMATLATACRDLLDDLPRVRLAHSRLCQWQPSQSVGTTES